MKVFSWQNLFIFSVAILPFSFALNPTPSIDLSLIRVLLPLIFLYWLLVGLFNKKVIVDYKLSFWFLLCFLFFCLISALYSPLKSLALKKFLFLSSFFSAYFLSYAITSTKKGSFLLLNSIVFSATLSSFLAIILFSLQFIIGLDPTLKLAQKSSVFFLGQNFSSLVIEYPSWLVNLGGHTVMRTFGSFPDPHLFAIFTNISIPFAGFLFIKTKNKLYLFSGFLMLVASLFSFSRAAYLALFLGAIFFCLFHFKFLTFFKKNFQLFLFLAAFLLVALVVPNPINQRFFSSFDLKEGSNSGRLQMWELALKTTLEKPFLGVGLGNFANYNFPMSPEKNPIYAHNLFLDFSSEIGIIGTIFLVAVFYLKIFQKKENSSFLKQAISVSIFIFLIHCFFETPFFSVRVLPLFFIILGIKTDD